MTSGNNEAGFTTTLALRDHRGVAEFEDAVTSDSQLAGVMAAAERLVVHLNPDADAVFKNGVADISFQLGLAAFSRLRWGEAIPYFENAVRAKPEFPTAWFYVALTRGWMSAPADQSRAAALRAIETASTDLERSLGRAVQLYIDRRWIDAAKTLEPLIEQSPYSRDLHYLYGEALFHDGQIRKGIIALETAIELAPRFGPARIHPREVAVARKSALDVRRLYGSNTRQAEALIAYISGDFDEANRKGYKRPSIWIATRDYAALDAQFLNGTDAAAVAYRLARKVQTGTRAEAIALFDREWPSLAKRTGPSAATQLGRLAQVALSAELHEPVRVLRQWWRTHEVPINLETRAELEVFAAMLLGDDQPDGKELRLSTRMKAISKSLELIGQGDLPGGLASLRVVVADPAGNRRDTTLHSIYLSLLSKDGRTAEHKAMCEAWNRPEIFSPAHVVIAARCDGEL